MTVSQRYKPKKSIIPKMSIQEEIEKDARKAFDLMDIEFEKTFGSMCPSFEPNCIQCQVNLEYNNFKLKFWEKFVRK